MTLNDKIILLTYIACISWAVRIIAISLLEEAGLKNSTSKCFCDIAILEPVSRLIE